jgi:signal transduction histidine kinase
MQCDVYDKLKEQGLMSVELTKAMEMRREFIRKVSHELRSPLNTTSLSLELLAKIVPSSSEILEIFDVRSH